MFGQPSALIVVIVCG